MISRRFKTIKEMTRIRMNNTFLTTPNTNTTNTGVWNKKCPWTNWLTQHTNITYIFITLSNQSISKIFHVNFIFSIQIIAKDFETNHETIHVQLSSNQSSNYVRVCCWWCWNQAVCSNKSLFFFRCYRNILLLPSISLIYMVDWSIKIFWILVQIHSLMSVVCQLLIRLNRLRAQ